MEFQEFPKIGRLSRDMVITEKIDGTNAQVLIRELPDDQEMPTDTPIVAVVGRLLIYAGSRSQYITPDRDNYGFAAWVSDHAEELATLGVGAHFGEWWGAGIQRRYGLTEKRFSLFNVGRWLDSHDEGQTPHGTQLLAPACCYVVPTIQRWTFNSGKVDEALGNLRAHGSFAAPGFMNPEGIVVFHTASGALFKKTLEKDDYPKSRESQAVMA